MRASIVARGANELDRIVGEEVRDDRERERGLREPQHDGPRQERRRRVAVLERPFGHHRGRRLDEIDAHPLLVEVAGAARDPEREELQVPLVGHDHAHRLVVGVGARAPSEPREQRDGEARRRDARAIQVGMACV